MDAFNHPRFSSLRPPACKLFNAPTASECVFRRAGPGWFNKAKLANALATVQDHGLIKLVFLIAATITNLMVTT